MSEIKNFSPKVVDEDADYGVLKALEGTWVNHNPDSNTTGWGLFTKCMPLPGTNTLLHPTNFHFLAKDYTEELTFTLIPEGIRNRGGANGQFSGAVKYSQNIQDLSGESLQEENGMYLWLSNPFNHPADEESVKADIGSPELAPSNDSNDPNYVPFYSIVRSSIVPHGSPIVLLGTDSFHTCKPFFPSGTDAWDLDFLSLSSSMGAVGTTPSTRINLDEKAPDWVFDKSLPEKEPSSNRTYSQRILADDLYPYSVRPDLRLRDAIKSQTIKSHTLIELTSREEGGAEGGISNTPFVSKSIPTTKMRFRMWIETVIENGEEVLQLQYEQIQFFEFHLGTDGSTTRWPHIQVNTLRKKQ